MSEASWVIDKSALVRLGESPDAADWASRIERGLVHITTVTLLEVGYSARSSAELNRVMTSAPVSAMPVEHSAPTIENRALDVQRQLAARGRHRAPSIPDLLISATAEINRHVVLHLDKDFELIAEVTGQAVERLRT